MSHTPGPWHIEHELNIFGGRRLVASAGGYQTNTANYLPESRANAILIAAAPELLEACEMAEKWISAAMLAAPEPPTDDTIAVLATVRSAIYKAKPHAAP